MWEVVVTVVLFAIVIFGLVAMMAVLDERDDFSEVGTELDRLTRHRRESVPERPATDLHQTGARDSMVCEWGSRSEPMASVGDCPLRAAPHGPEGYVQ